MAGGKVCVIGAGSSGIAVAKALAERGIPFDCFEKSDRVGGNWVFGNRNGQSRIYRSLHVNTSRDRMAYPDFPMPRDYPDFPHHTLMARYLSTPLSTGSGCGNGSASERRWSVPSARRHSTGG
jgi:cation diffusion facilitator CzcD-associated flavoprotein CzcO